MSLEVDLFRLNEFESHYKFTGGGEKWLTYAVSGERREISLTVLLVNCHDIIGRIFDGEFRAKQVWNVLKKGITNQEKNNKNKQIKRLLESVVTQILSTEWSWP